MNNHTRSPFIALPLVTLMLLLAPQITRAEKVKVALEDATIPELQMAMEQGTLTAEALIKMCLARIEAYDDAGPELNSILYYNPEVAITTAQMLDKERAETGSRGLLHGIPVIPKDNYNTFDMPTTGGFRGLEGSIPDHDAFTIRRLREEGAIILAKANLDEFNSGSSGTSGLGGQTKNPYNLLMSPGGSSAGTGAALAAVFGQIGLGTETGSSIRNPSTKNNLVGVAPTLGLVSRHGVVPSSILLDRTGPMARNVTDAAIMLHTLSGMDAGDLMTVQAIGHYEPEGYMRYLKVGSLKNARIGVLRENFGDLPEAVEGRAVADIAIAALDNAGAVNLCGIAGRHYRNRQGSG
jgi:amidase